MRFLEEADYDKGTYSFNKDRFFQCTGITVRCSHSGGKPIQKYIYINIWKDR
jgi:hypothetical protein